MSTASDFTAASQAMNGLSTLTKKSYPGASALFTLGSTVTGVLGTLFGSSAAKRKADATAKFQGEVLNDLKAALNDLSDIDQQLKVISGQLSDIESELNSVYSQLEEGNDLRLAELFGYIDTDFGNLKSYDLTTENGITSIQSYAPQVFNSSASTYYTMNTLEEFINFSGFKNGQTLLEGNISIPAYMYIRSKLLLGLSVLGYACQFIEGRDFGTEFKTWSQNLANHLKTIIQYGQSNPNKVDYSTAHFKANWYGTWITNTPQTNIPLYCTDSLCFSAAITPIMPQKIWMGQLNPTNDSLYDTFLGGDVPFVNTFTAPGPDQHLNSVWFYKKEQLVNKTITDNDGNQKNYGFWVNPINPNDLDNPTNYNLITAQDFAASYLNKTVLLIPYTHLTSADGDLYLGSVDGMLNVLPYVSENNYSPIIAFLYDGTTKEKLLQPVQNGYAVNTVLLDNLNSLTDCTVQINFESFVTENSKKIYIPNISIQFLSSGLYLGISPSGDWYVSGDKKTLMLDYGPTLNQQPIQSPLEMKPVSLYLTENSPNGGTRNLIVHQSPFE
ncbi:hypothetical protein [Roseivirga sp.]|uniref:hypothetical protein n=1 Tax=Roseivirga sp. TaxID=1964215 RepID=UPI003B521834